MLPGIAGDLTVGEGEGLKHRRYLLGCQTGRTLAPSAKQQPPTPHIRLTAGGEGYEDNYRRPRPIILPSVAARVFHLCLPCRSVSDSVCANKAARVLIVLPPDPKPRTVANCGLCNAPPPPTPKRIPSIFSPFVQQSLIKVLQRPPFCPISTPPLNSCR